MENEPIIFKSLENLSIHLSDLIKANINLQGKMSCLDDEIKYLKNRILVLELKQPRDLNEEFC